MKAGRFTVRRISPADIPVLLQITEDCRLSPWSEDDYIEEAKRIDSIMLCLESAAGETVGFLVGRRVMSPSSVQKYDADLYNIGVKAKFQKRGCGRMLLNRFLELCRREKVNNVWLDVRFSNKNAIQFYKKFCFVEHTVRTRFYSDPTEDGIVMKLTL